MFISNSKLKTTTVEEEKKNTYMLYKYVTKEMSLKKEHMQILKNILSSANGAVDFFDT